MTVKVMCVCLSSCVMCLRVSARACAPQFQFVISRQRLISSVFVVERDLGNSDATYLPCKLRQLGARRGHEWPASLMKRDEPRGRRLRSRSHERDRRRSRSHERGRGRSHERGRRRSRSHERDRRRSRSHERGRRRSRSHERHRSRRERDMRRSGSSERHMHMHGRPSGPREQAAPAFVDILFDADEERHRRGWRSIAVPASACVADLRRMVFDTVPTCGAETDAHLVLQTEDGARLYAAMSLAEAGLGPGSRIVWRSGRADGLRKLLEPEAPTELHGHAKRQKTFALEMKFGGRPPIDPYSRELELIEVELPGEVAGSLHGIEGQAARAAAQKAAGSAVAFVKEQAPANALG